MNALKREKIHTNFDNLEQFGVSELSKKELSKTSGGLAGAAAAAAGAALVGGAFLAGVAIGVGVYYGVKALTN